MNQQDKTESIYDTSTNPEGFFSDATSSNACSVRVAVRVRPLVGRELYDGTQKTCIVGDEVKNNVIIGDKSFNFDKVFYQGSEQVDLFNICAKNLVLGCFAGFNATILAYGQTGSGKTHTMGTSSTMGLPPEVVGIVPRVFEFIFEELERKKQESSFSQFTIKCSFLELYNEELHDLLDPNSIGALDKNTGKPVKELQIREEKSGAITIPGLKEEVVSSKEECLQYLNKGILYRTTSSTLMNESSSRSHAIFTVIIEQRIITEMEGQADGGVQGEPIPSSQEEHISAKFHFVDLAGSERIKKTGATGQVLKEGININKGLLCLGNVISALTEESKREKHIPYRDSKLTRILTDSLGGNSRTTMIACVSPAESNYEESLNTLKYASRARNIKNKPVINRDPNSILIEGLRNQITTLQGEVQEYHEILKQHNIEVPQDFQQRISDRLENMKSPLKGSIVGPSFSQSGPSLGSQGTMNQASSQEIRDLKIKASKKEKELKEVQEELQRQIEKVKAKQSEIQKIRMERDNLKMKNDMLEECLRQNNVEVSAYNEEKNRTFIEEYENIIQQMEADFEEKDQQILEFQKKINTLTIQQKRDEELLKKHMEENNRIKKEMKKFEEQGFQMKPITPNSRQNSYADLYNKAKPKHEINELINEEYLNKKFIDGLASQLESLFITSETENTEKSERSGAESVNPSSDVASEPLQQNEEDIHSQVTLDDKEKILERVKQGAKAMHWELIELMKIEYEKKIREVEEEQARVDAERQLSLEKAENDNKQIGIIEEDYKQKMDDLAKQLKEYKDKEKKQDGIQKQLMSQEMKIKALENDLIKQKKEKESMSQALKFENEKFSKFKKTLASEITTAKKQVQDKEKQVTKLKQDLKKTDQLAQAKVAELRGLQKRIQEERQKREEQKQKQYEKTGIDVDRIKTWINENTQKMLIARDLKDKLDAEMRERDGIEDEMLEIGDRLTDLMLKKERKEIEKLQIEAESDENLEENEGKLLEIEEEVETIDREILQITENLDSMDETLEFKNNKINKMCEEIAQNDLSSVEPLKFSGLQSVEAAKVTLQTFFGVLLDLNVYKRDLEHKCIEQDESILSLNEKIQMMNMRIDELMQNGMVQSQLGGDLQSKQFFQQKEKVLKNIVQNLEGYVDYSELRNIKLTPNEQTSLTKLSLSKIVSNLKQKLQEEETKNQNLGHKLEQAINEKEAFKQKYVYLQNMNKQGKPTRGPNSARGQSNLEGKTPHSFIQKRFNIEPVLKKQASKHIFKFKQQRKFKKEEQTIEEGGQSEQPKSAAKPRVIHKKLASSTVANIPPVQSVTKSRQREASSSVGREQVTQKNRFGFTGRSVAKTPFKSEGGGDGTFFSASQKTGQNKVPSLRERRNMKKLENQDGDKTNTSNLGVQNLEGLGQASHSLSKREKNQNSSPAKTGMSLQQRRNLKKQENRGSSKGSSERKKQRTQSNEIRSTLNQHVEVSHSISKIPNLKDRRNQKKLETNTKKGERARSNTNDIQRFTSNKNQEIDKIKETSQQMAQDHEGRVQERHRAYSNLRKKKGFSIIPQPIISSLNSSTLEESKLQNMRDMIDDTIIETAENPSPEPVIRPVESKRSSPNIPKLNIQQLDLEEDPRYETLPAEEDEPEEPHEPEIPSPSRDHKNKWVKDDLLLADFKGHKLIDYDYLDKHFVAIFQNFEIQQFDLDQSLMTRELNLLEHNGIELQSREQVLAVGLDKELGMLAVSSNSGIYLFDFFDEFHLINKIEVKDALAVCFCQFNVITLQKDENEVFKISSFQFEEEPPCETGSFELRGMEVLVKTYRENVYFVCDNSVGKLSVPDLQVLFQIETPHTDTIIDFAFSSNLILTTSKDYDFRGFDIESGEEILPYMEGLECSLIVADGQFIFTKCGAGEAVIVWKQPAELGNELDIIEEIEMDQFEGSIVTDFKMKGQIKASLQGKVYELIMFITIVEDNIVVQGLKHVPLDEQ